MLLDFVVLMVPALLVAAVGSAIGMAILILFPKAMYPTTTVGGLDHLLATLALRTTSFKRSLWWWTAAGRPPAATP